MNNKLLVYISFFVLLVLACLISGYTVYSQSIRLDEAQSLWFYTKSIPTIIHLSAQDVNLPLYGFFLHFWIQIFGTDIIFARTLSFLFFLLTLPVIYQVAKENSSKNLAIVNTLLFALSPFIIWYSTETRTYTLFVLLTSLSNLFFLRILNSQGKTGYIGYFITTVLGFYTHYFFFFLVLSQLLYFLWKLRSIAHQHIEESLPVSIWNNRKSIFKLLTPLFIAFLLFVPYLYYVAQLGSASNTKPLIAQPTSFNIFLTFSNFLFGFQNTTIQSIIISLWPLLIVLLFLVFTQRHHTFAKNITYFGFISFVPVIIIFGISFIRPIFLSRYLIFVTPTLFFLLAWIFMSYSKKTTTLLITGYTIISLALSLYQTISVETPVREDYKTAALYLQKHASDSDIITVTAPFTIYPLEYSYMGTNRIDTIPYWNRYAQGAIPSFTIQKLDQQIKEYQKQYQHLFVVFSYDQGYEKQVKYFLDTHYQRLANVELSPNLNIREYKLRY